MITINISADLVHLTQRLDAIDQKLADHTARLDRIEQGVAFVLSNQAEQKAVLDHIEAVIAGEFVEQVESLTSRLSSSTSALRQAVENQPLT